MDTPITDPDFDLLQAAFNAPEGDLRAFEQLVERYQRRILANCRYLTRDEKYYEDLAQEVFVKAFFALKTFEGRSSFRSWLKRIKVNHCLSHMKKEESRLAQSIDDETSGTFERLQVEPQAPRDLDQQDQQRRIEAILNSLPPTLRIPLVMCDMDELSYEEIAESLGLGLSATKMRIKRAREQFRERYA
jgi:RNA polymerase sigma-70 factor (ECF subfamily)